MRARAIFWRARFFYSQLRLFRVFRVTYTRAVVYVEVPSLSPSHSPPSKQIIDYFVNAQQQLKRGGVGGERDNLDQI